MILRSLAKHVKEQNWFTVILEIVILVIGVFIGLQVQEWANDKERQQREAIYLERLHEEVLRVIDLRSPNVTRRLENLESLNKAFEVITDNTKAIIDKPKLCTAITLATVMSDITPDLPTLTELLSAGQLDTISSNEIRSALINLMQTRERGTDALSSITKDILPLYKSHRDLMYLKGNLDTTLRGIEHWSPECDFDAMRTSRLFITDLVDIRIRYMGYINIINRTTAKLNELHQALDNALGVEHPQEPNAS